MAVAQRSQQPVAAVPAVPFTAAAHEHQEPAFVVSATLSAATQQINPINLPAFGFLRNIFLDVVASGGVAGTLNADGPFNILQSVTLLDVNGAPICGPIDGYALLWANIAGGYAFNQDPRKLPGYVAAAPNPAFQLRIPIEIAHFNALGSLANQNAAAPYQLLITLNSRTNVTSADWTTPPLITITGTLECWTLPAATDVNGRPQQQLPPAHGTGQFWSSRTPSVVAGNQTLPISRVGNLMRAIAFICRNATPARADNVFPDPIIINWDGRQLVNESQRYRIAAMFEKLNNTTRDTGVFLYPFDHSQENRAGDDTPNLWLPTVQSTRLEVNGSFGAPGTVQIVVNDIQPIEVNPADRYAESNATSPTASGAPPSVTGS